MKIESIDIDKTINEAKMIMENEVDLSSSFKAIIQVFLILVSILINRLKLNSSNSSKPPSMDPNLKRKKKNDGDKKQVGQNGHKGYRLEKVKDPDIVKILKVDKKTIHA